ncbi:MAG: TIGR03643 family protein [Proteobacteria bacterium ST_bin12]|nr:MAG: TIGR03643 family protein [Proteobacteria bacterium ST_bin12]
MLLDKKLIAKELSEEDISRVIEMAWEDRTPFEAIEMQFGLNQDGVIKLMRKNLKLNSFKLWRERTHGQVTKHLKLRSEDINRHQSRQHNKLHR